MVDCFHVDDEGVLWFKDRLVVPKNHELHKKIFDEDHTSKYSIHPGPRSTAPWTQSMEFSVENLIRKSVISGILQRSPSGFPLNPQSIIFQSDPLSLKNIYKKVPNLRKIHKNSSKISKIHIFPTTTPNPVILVPKFLE
jgi:hypothetical protein